MSPTAIRVMAPDVDPEGTSRVVTNLIDAGALVVFVPLSVIAILLSGPVARRLGSSRILTALALVSIAGIIAVTIRERDLVAWLSNIDAVIVCAGWHSDSVSSCCSEESHGWRFSWEPTSSETR